MGIYPREEFQKHPNGTLTRTYDDFSGLETTTVYVPILEIQKRDTCYCCSCPSDRDGYSSMADPFCRNHGFAGTRPCDDHGMPGEADDDGNMPRSVQEKRAYDKDHS